MLRTNEVTKCTLELESIENELQQVIERMRSNSTAAKNGTASPAPPPGFPTPSNTGITKPTIPNRTNWFFVCLDQQHSTVNKTDKLRELMQRCKKLINIILVLDDYVTIDENDTKYIQENLPFLNSSKTSSTDDRLYQHYSELLANLTRIVNNLQQQL